MQFFDALRNRNSLFNTRLPANWDQVELKCPSCGRLFIGHKSPREDARDGALTARRKLIRTCPDHLAAFKV